MQKIIKIFSNIRFEDFIRIIIFDNRLRLIRITNGKIVERLDVDLIEKIKITDYLKRYSSVPMEIIISSNTMSCRSISLNGQREKDIIALADNVVNEKNGSVNLVCYEKRISYRSGCILFCDMKLTPVILTILQEMLKVGNSLIAVITWPFWIVSSYFGLHPTERGKFATPIFVIKTKENWEMIVLYKGKYVYYRKGNIHEFSEENEVSNAMKFVKRLFNVDLEDISIYELNDNTLDTFTDNSNISMKMISPSIEFNMANKVQNLNFMVKTACSLAFVLLFVNTVLDVVRIFGYNHRIENAKKTITAVDPEIVDEIAMWGNLDNYIYVKHLGIKNKIADAVKGKQKKLQNASIKVDEETKRMTLSTIYEDE